MSYEKRGVRTDLELRHLRAFVAVVDTGSHTRAARALAVSQSTVSETLASLERALGTTLFRKERRGAALTPSGEALLPFARRILALATEATSELAKIATDVRATFVVAANESLAGYVLPARLAELRARWPKTRFEIVTGACADIRASVASGSSDVGLVLEQGGAADDASVLAEARLVVVGGKKHPFARRVASPAELGRFEFFMCDVGGNYHHVLRDYFVAAGLTPPRTQVLGSIEGVKRGVVGSGPAVGLLPEHAVAGELDDGTLVELRMAPPLPRLVLRAVVSSDGATSPIASALLEAMRRTPLARATRAS